MTLYKRMFAIALVLAGAVGFSAAPARAGISAGGGFLTAGGNGTSENGGALFLSTGSGVPIVPVELDLTGFAPLISHGGYAVTVEGRFGFKGNALGVGYGISQFGQAHSGGTATAFFDTKIAPLTSLELRGFFPTGTRMSTAGFVGLRFSL
jgi:hypothetical protein